MLITIQQTKSNYENLFEVSCCNQVLFHAKAPWMNVSLPFNADNVRKLTFSNAAGENLYTTRYSIIDNMLEETIPFKYLLSKGQRFGQFEIIGNNGREGAFYTLQNGYFDKRFCLEHEGKVYLGYDIQNGISHIISIFDDDVQIAQITKPLATVDNLDVYYLHIKDELEALIPVLSFFVIYFDYRRYNNSGEITKNSVEISVGYSYDKNNSKYNPNWISQEFGQQAADELSQIITKQREEITAKAKKLAKIIGISFLVLFVLILIIVFVILHIITG